MASITFEHRYTVGGYITFAVEVMSGNFSGASSFCIPSEPLRDTVSCLNVIYNDLIGSYKVEDYDSSDFILFEFLKYGHLKISGQIGGCHRENYLIYQFVTDQTALREIISDLSSMLASEGC